MQTTVYQKLRSAIRDFMRSPGTFGQSKLRARVFIDETEPELCRLFLLETAEKLMRLEEREAVRQAESGGEKDEAQMKLLGPGFAELFTSLRQKLPLKTGRKAVLDLMTVSQMRESAIELRSQAKKRIDQNAEKDERRSRYLDGLADAMAPYAATHRGLNFREYRDLVAAAAVAPAPAKSAAAKR